MITKFNANCVSASIEGEDEDSYISVAFDNGEFDNIEYLILQKAISFTEDDKELGLEKVYIEYKDQHYSKYGGILKVILKDGLIDIYIDNNTSKVLGTNEQIGIAFSQDATNIYDLKLYLQKMFENDIAVFVSEV